MVKTQDQFKFLTPEEIKNLAPGTKVYKHWFSWDRKNKSSILYSSDLGTIKYVRETYAGWIIKFEENDAHWNLENITRQDWWEKVEHLEMLSGRFETERKFHIEEANKTVNKTLAFPIKDIIREKDFIMHRLAQKDFGFWIEQEDTYLEELKTFLQS